MIMKMDLYVDFMQAMSKEFLYNPEKEQMPIKMFQNVMHIFEKVIWEKVEDK